MTIFGESRLGRIGYAVVLLLMFCFDFGKEPVQRFIMSLHDKAAAELSTPQPVVDRVQSSTGRQVNAPNMPLMLKGQEDAVRSMVASGRKPTAADIEKARRATQQAALQAVVGGAPDGDARTARLVGDRASYEMLYVIAAIAMTSITVVGLLWMVSSRLRDIGWPQLLLWALLAPVFLPKFVGLPLPALAVQAITIFFYGVLLVLAFIPGQGSTPIFQAKRPLPQPVPVRRKPGQFGRLGLD